MKVGNGWKLGLGLLLGVCLSGFGLYKIISEPGKTDACKNLAIPVAVEVTGGTLSVDSSGLRPYLKLICDTGFKFDGASDTMGTCNVKNGSETWDIVKIRPTCSDTCSADDLKSQFGLDTTGLSRTSENIACVVGLKYFSDETITNEKVNLQVATSQKLTLRRGPRYGSGGGNSSPPQWKCLKKCDVKTIYTNDKATVQYVGQVDANNKYHGLGTCFYPTGSKFENYTGQFKEGQREGLGSVTLGKSSVLHLDDNTYHGTRAALCSLPSSKTTNLSPF
eukprot:936379_1